MRQSIQAVMLGTLVIGLSACGTSGNDSAASKIKNPNSLTLDQIKSKAKKEGKVVSVGMPDSWANWKDTWKDITNKYGIKHTDTNMSSAEEIAKFQAEKNKPTADIGDVGISFGPLAKKKGLTLPYKTQYFKDIPDWAKDKDGNWIVGYQGTIAVITNKDLVKNPPKTWDDLLHGKYKVTVGDVQKATQAQMAVLSAAIAHGGSEKNIQPGIDYFAKIAKQGRLVLTDPDLASLEKGETEVALLWDFNALNYADKINRKQFDVHILKEGSVVSGYAEIINKYAPHPHAAMLARDYILSDQGQINLAKGYARPIRSDVKLPPKVAAKMIPKGEYKNAQPIKDYKAWDKTVKQLPQKWQESVLVNVK